MLLSLRIENFALVDYLELDLGAGLTVLTGETGAGKSIILDAIDAALGGKVNSRAVRTGTERACIEATFQTTEELQAWLEQQGIPPLDSDGLVCSREITVGASGQRSRSRINGVVVNKQQLEQVRDRLVEITAQGQTVQLGHPPLQRQWLDSYGGDPLLQQRQQVAIAFAAYQQAAQTLDKRRRSEQQRLQQLDLLEFQLKELNSASLTNPDELEQLEQERQRLNHSVELQQQSYQVYRLLYESDGEASASADLLGRAESLLQHMTEYDRSLQPLLDLVSTALSQVEEAGRQINFYGENLEADPQRLEEVQQRIGVLKQICRKYGPTLADAIALQDRLQQDLLNLTDQGQSVEELEALVQERQTALSLACGELTRLRQATARRLEERLVAELKPLAMEKVKFEVQLTPCTPSAMGADQVTFQFSPNPGEPLQPLIEIASGGEMSRFLLALQASFSGIDPVGTLVFDEIDVGVSGRITQAIAEKLFHLSQHHQVLCVTHQPIVAAMASQHFRVSKQVIGGNGSASQPTNANGAAKKRSRKDDSADAPPLEPTPTDEERTVVRVVLLTPEQRREELAQLAGGQTDQEAIAFADALLAQADKIRQAEATQPLPIDLLQPPSATPSKANRSKTAKRL